MRIYLLAIQSEMVNDSTGELETITVAVVPDDSADIAVRLLSQYKGHTCTRKHTCGPGYKARWWLSFVPDDEISNLVWDC